MELNINLNELICDTFVDIAGDIINCEVDRAVLKGGRASTKSQVASECIITGCMVYKESAVACVRYGNKVFERLVSTFSESIRYMGVEQFWKLRKSPFEYVLLDEDGKETDVSIKFTGCDNPDDLKSYKPRRGNFRYVWFEETATFDSMKSLNNLIQTFARGGKCCVIMTYNPPMSNSSFVNREFNSPKIKDNIIKRDGSCWYEYFDFDVDDNTTERLIKAVHHSTYLDVIKSGHADWLGPTFIGEAKQCEVENPTYYKFAYLGLVVGTNANVFNNIVDWDGNTDNLDIVEIFRGLDWGYGGPDSTHYIESYYDRINKRVYLLNEFGRPKMSIDEVAFGIKELNKHNFPVFADSANPLLNSELVNKDVNIIGAIKGPDSVLAGIKWLQSLNGIYICKYRTPEAYREMTEYEYLLDKEENVTSKLQGDNDHSISALRYSYNLEIKYF